MTAGADGPSHIAAAYLDRRRVGGSRMDHDRFDELRAKLERALRTDQPTVGRLSYADTIVAIDVAEIGRSLTLLLDRTPPAIAAVDEGKPAEITLSLTLAQLAAFAGGALSLPAAVISGQVQAHGPVRKYLEVDAILRGILATAPARPLAPEDHLVGEPGEVEVDPSLLAIETRGLRKRFGTHDVLAGVDLTIPEGCISVVLGPSGTGKSVLLQHLIGLLEPDHGEVLIRGRSVSDMSAEATQSLRRGIGVMFQDGALFSAMNVFENVAFPLRQHTDLSDAEVADVVGRQLAQVGLTDAAGRLPGELSGGMRKRAGLARALALEPSILLVDEPDSGLDPVRTSLLGDLLVAQHAEYGGTMLVVTHNVALAKRIGDHISVLWRGHVLASGLTAEIETSREPLVRQLLAGETSGPLGMDS